MTNQHYELPVWNTIKASWNKVYGSKGTFWIALIIAFVIIIALSIFDLVLKKSAPAIEPIAGIIIMFIRYLINMGIMYIGIKRAMDTPITFDMMFRAFQDGLPWKIIGLVILNSLILLIPIMITIVSIALYPIFNTAILSVILCIIGSFATIYLAIRLYMSMGFVLDKELGPVNAIKYSFRATEHNFWNLIGIMIIQIIILILLALPLGIGLIWGLPFAFINYGMVYRSLSSNISQ